LLLYAHTRPSLLYDRLFLTLGENTHIVMTGLMVIAVFFGIIEAIALFIGIRLSRTMTASVAELYTATEHINKGRLSHRIQVKRNDQLAALEHSFNSMAASLEDLLAEQKEKHRIDSELAIAHEVQALLFPSDRLETEGLEVHGICRPARTVSGDYYDYLPLGQQRLGLAVGDISGKGISAALLMATVHAFVRAYTLGSRAPQDGGVTPSGLLATLNNQLYEATPQEKYATLFVGIYDQHNRSLTYSNAGHLPPLLVGPGGTLRRLDAGGTVVGLFPDMEYPQQTVTLAANEILVAYSDGITEPENEFGEFGEERLVELIQENRQLPLERISAIVMAAVDDWRGAEEQSDDITLVLARAR
jgi:sigma-B regulation protein RsbU (phosphoserine phosphatase)